MTTDTTTSPIVVRTERGLTIAGTRITLYSVMDYVKEDWPPKLIRDWLNLTDEQIAGVMQYIAEHREVVEAEYEQVVREAEEIRAYWEERNREKIKQIEKLPPSRVRRQSVPRLPHIRPNMATSDERSGRPQSGGTGASAVGRARS
jgi:uncharacterized protein (DUF433 family)